MKKIVINAFIALALITGLTSCTDEQDLMISSPKGSFAIKSPQSGETVVLSPTTPLNPGLSLSWSSMDYTSPTQVSYAIQVVKTGNSFDTPIVITTTSNTFATVTSADLNGAAVAAGLTPFTQGSLDVRIASTVAGTQEAYSNVINYLITPYTTELPKLAVPGNHQGWSPSTAPLLRASAFGATDYEGYVYLDGGFKFIGASSTGTFNWGTNEYGDDGSFSGVLQPTGSNCTAVAGYYKVKANTTTLTYSTELTNWGIVGAATPSGWGSSTQLTYNATTKKWEGIMALTAGEFKFRANQAWAINFGGDPNAMTQDGANLSVAAAGTYKVELDLSNARKYTYTLTLQ